MERTCETSVRQMINRAITKSDCTIYRHRMDTTIAIETSLILRLVFHLSLRQAEGFLKSILKRMDLYLSCPYHTTVSRRNRTINVCRCTGSLPDVSVHFIVDSTGLKIC